MTSYLFLSNLDPKQALKASQFAVVPPTILPPEHDSSAWQIVFFTEFASALLQDSGDEQNMVVAANFETGSEHDCVAVHRNIFESMDTAL